MKTHELKILPQYYNQILDGSKSFELRKDDRDYNINDYLRLKEWDGTKFTGRTYLCSILSILKDCKDYGLMDGYVILSIG